MKIALVVCHVICVNNQRRRQEVSSMPLFAAVASPELASGKVWISRTKVTNTMKSNTFIC